MKLILKENPFVVLPRLLWRTTKGRHGHVSLYAALGIIAMSVSMCGPLVIAWVLNSIQGSAPGDLVNGMLEPFLILAALPFVFWLFHGPGRVIETITAFGARSTYVNLLLGKSLGLPLRWHKSHHSGKTIDQINRASASLAQFAETSFEWIYMFVRCIVVVAALTYVMPVAGLIILCVASGLVLMIVLFDRVITDQYQRLNDGYNNVNAAVQDYLTNISTVVTLRLEAAVCTEVRERLERMVPEVTRNARLNETKWFLASCAVATMRTGILFLYVYRAAARGESIEIGSLFVLIEYLIRLDDTFMEFNRKYGDLLMKTAAVRKVEHVERIYGRLAQRNESARLPEAWSLIQIRGLSFSYDESDETGLSHVEQLSVIDFDLQRGRSYAFIGESGSGKSTALGILRGIYHAKPREVLCDGVPLEFGLAHAAHHTTLIPQKPEIFSNTIRFNLAMGLPVVSDAEIEAVVMAARFSDVVRRLPSGLETHIAEKGVNLSGGEGQRLALARGLLFIERTGSDIVLLDEPTSSVDPQNERAIYEHVLAKYRDRCIVSALHRLSLLHLFDEVLVFERGRIVERGVLAELLERRGALWRQWQAVHSSNRRVVGGGSRVGIE